MKILYNVLTTSLGKYIQIAASLITVMVLARYLTPEQFGGVALILVYNNFLLTIIDGGISSAIIQFKKYNKNFIDSCFTISLSTSILIFFAISILLLYLNSSTYISRKTTELMLLSMINLVILGFLVVPYGLLQKNKKFAQIAGADTFAALTSGILAIVLAANGVGELSLIVQYISSLFIRCSIYFIYGEYKPRFYINSKSVRYLYLYSASILIFNSINFWSRNADKFIIGRFFGDTALGLYSQAYRVMLIPVQLVSSIVNALSHSYLAVHKKNSAMYSDSYLKILQYTLYFSLPMGFVIIFNSKVLLVFLFGQNWLPASDFLLILGFLSIIQPVVVTSGEVFKSKGRTDLLLKLGLFNTVVLISGMLAGSYFSSVGVAIGYTLSYAFILTPITMFLVFRVSSISLKRVFHAFTSPILNSLLFLFVMFFTNFFLGDFEELIRFFISLFLASASWIIAFYLTAWRELKNDYTI